VLVRLGSLMDAPELRRILDAERARGLERFAAAATLDELEAARTDVLGRKSPMSQAQRALGALDEDERREIGKVANEVRGALQGALDARRLELEADAETELLRADRVDLSLARRGPRNGGLGPHRQRAGEQERVFN